MKVAIILILLLFQCSVMAQTDTAPSERKKPSWTEDLPDRIEKPEFEMEEIDTSIDMGELTMDRESLFNDEEEQPLPTLNTEQDDSESQGDIQADNAKQNEQARLVEEKKQADLLAEKQRLAEQRRREEILAEQELAAQRKLAEEQKRADDKILAEEKQLQEEQAAETSFETTQTELDATDASQTEDDIQAEPAVLEKTVEVADKTTPTLVVKDSVSQNKYKWKKTKNVLPKYPAKAARDGKQGWVDVEFIIDNSGSVVGAHPIKTFKNSKAFNKAALRAVRQWKFEPPINYGIESNQTKTVRVVFNLSEKP